MSTTDTRNTLLQEVHADSDRDFLREKKLTMQCDPLARFIRPREDNMPAHGKVVNRGYCAPVSDLTPVRETGMNVRGKSRKSMLGQVNSTQERALNNVERETCKRKPAEPHNKNMVMAQAMLKAFLAN